MIVCLCNALSEKQVGAAIAEGARRPKDIHAACACRAQCGACVRRLLALLRDGSPAAPARAG